MRIFCWGMAVDIGELVNVLGVFQQNLLKREATE
jgi:hypothetical protein